MRGVEEARAQHQVTVAAVTAARDRLAGVSRNPVGAQGELIVSAPFDGVVQRVSAVPGQTVAASAGLLEIAQVDTLWVRVSSTRVTRRKSITRNRYRSRGSAMRYAGPRHPCRRAAPRGSRSRISGAPLCGRSGAACPAPGRARPRRLPMKSNTRGLVIPDAAVLYDIHGATWVYEDLGSNAYARRRVEVARNAGDRAVVNRGISEGAKVVTTGALRALWHRVRSRALRHALARRHLAPESHRRHRAGRAPGGGGRDGRCPARRSMSFLSLRRHWSKCRPRRPVFRPTKSSRSSRFRSNQPSTASPACVTIRSKSVLGPARSCSSWIRRAT